MTTKHGYQMDIQTMNQKPIFQIVNQILLRIVR